MKLCPQFSAWSPLVWESSTWVTTTCRIQEWSCCVQDLRVHTVRWKLSGRGSTRLNSAVTFPTSQYSEYATCMLFCVFVGCQAVSLQKKAVVFLHHLWVQTPPIWESWTWATIISATQEWSDSLLDWRIQNGAWTLSGMKRPPAATDNQSLETWRYDQIWETKPHKTLNFSLLLFNVVVS